MILNRTLFTPCVLVERQGCPAQLTPTYQISSQQNNSRALLIHEYTTMRLVHMSKNGAIKNTLPLALVHHELELASLVHQNSGASNILVTKMSVDCLVTDGNNNATREYFTFDLRIPGANSDQQAVFSYDLIEQAYGGKANLYAALQHLHALGQSVINPNQHKHGHQASYNPNFPAHDQYIRHTEQMLAAYLALPEAAAMLCNYIKAMIRGQHPGASHVKIYNLILNMHSKKTCCSNCESVVMGLVNDQNGAILQSSNILLGLLPNFQTVCAEPDEKLQISFPRRSPFRMLVTVTASEPDAHHKAQPTYTQRSLQPQDEIPPFDIDVKSQNVSRTIFTGMLNLPFDAHRLPPPSEVIYPTIAISGSNATLGSPHTMRSVRQARDAEMDGLATGFEELGI